MPSKNEPPLAGALRAPIKSSLQRIRGVQQWPREDQAEAWALQAAWLA